MLSPAFAVPGASQCELPNPSVEPTASGLRPPAAAHLKRWGTQIPA
jgi:hypothetical protein